MVTFATLCYTFRGGKVLLLLKTRGLFGEGRWNAPGGKLLAGETPEVGAVREVYEEAGVSVRNLRFHGVLNFYLGRSRKLDQTVFIFSSRLVRGRLKRSVEGQLKWFAKDRIPYDRMWDDDKVWLPLMLEGRGFIGNFYFSAGYQKLKSYSLKETEPI